MTSSPDQFKFSCPSCAQNIEIAIDLEGRRVECPSCKAAIIIPAPPKQEGAVPVATPAQPVARPEPSGPAKPAAPTPAPPREPVVAPSEAHSPFSPPDSTDETGSKEKEVVEPVATVPTITDTRVAVLTPQLKLEIVRDVRSQLADESLWLPGKKEGGEYNYAARREGEKLVPVSPTDASATHRSLFGAVLLEFHRHNVVGVTAGRREFLDEELIAAIHEVLGREPGAPPISEADREALTHEQCLKVLDLMAGRYQREADAAGKKEAHRKIEQVRLSDLVSKLENRAPLRAEDVACALYYELEEIKQRLDALERARKPGD